jgi:hypothetical protein
MQIQNMLVFVATKSDKQVQEARGLVYNFLKNG